MPRADTGASKERLGWVSITSLVASHTWIDCENSLACPSSCLSKGALEVRVAMKLDPEECLVLGQIVKWAYDFTPSELSCVVTCDGPLSVL